MITSNGDTRSKRLLLLNILCNHFGSTAIKRLTATVSNRQALALKLYAIQCVLHNGVLFFLVIHDFLPISVIEI